MRRELDPSEAMPGFHFESFNARSRERWLEVRCFLDESVLQLTPKQSVRTDASELRERFGLVGKLCTDYYALSENHLRPGMRAIKEMVRARHEGADWKIIREHERKTKRCAQEARLDLDDLVPEQGGMR